MKTRIACPSCGFRAAIDEKFAGKAVKCPQCKVRIEVPLQSHDGTKQLTSESSRITSTATKQSNPASGALDKQARSGSSHRASPAGFLGLLGVLLGFIGFILTAGIGMMLGSIGDNMAAGGALGAVVGLLLMVIIPIIVVQKAKTLDPIPDKPPTWASCTSYLVFGLLGALFGGMIGYFGGGSLGDRFNLPDFVRIASALVFAAGGLGIGATFGAEVMKKNWPRPASPT